MKVILQSAPIWAKNMIFMILAVVCFMSLSESGAQGASPSRPFVGGVCDYKKYQGEAEIISVAKRAGAPEQYEIAFSFHTQELINEDFARIEGRKWLLVQDDSRYPGADFLIQYEIKKGKRFLCYLKVITRGTCTPLLFEFPAIAGGKAK